MYFNSKSILYFWEFQNILQTFLGGFKLLYLPLHSDSLNVETWNILLTCGTKTPRCEYRQIQTHQFYLNLPRLRIVCSDYFYPFIIKFKYWIIILFKWLKIIKKIIFSKEIILRRYISILIAGRPRFTAYRMHFVPGL